MRATLAVSRHAVARDAIAGEFASFQSLLIGQVVRAFVGWGDIGDGGRLERAEALDDLLSFPRNLSRTC